MAGVRWGVAYWPGIIGVKRCTYSVSHGIQPGTAVLETQPQPFPPDLAGTLVITDGGGYAILPRCKVKDIHSEASSSGLVWKIVIEDRRWKWRDCGCITGWYNQPDQTGQFNRPPSDSGPILASPVKYVPWTVRTPTQLAAYCLTAMGESRYQIILPSASTGLPEVNWDYINPAAALEHLCQSLGCRVIYRIDTDSVLIAPLGVGADLPAGAISREAPSLGIPPMPDWLMLVGAPVRYQCRILLEPVAEDWDGQLRPINEVSYAPSPVLHRAEYELTPVTPDAGTVWTVTLDVGLPIDEEVSYTAAGTSVSASVNGIVNAVNGSLTALQGKAKATASLAGTSLTILGPANGATLVCRGRASLTASIPDLKAKMIRAAQVTDNPWLLAAPPSFAGVRATDRLTREMARNLARKCVFRYFRIRNVDPFTGKGQLNVPAFGLVKRIQQILLHPTRLDMTVATQADFNVTKGNDALIQDIYDGYSRERKASAYGSHYPSNGGVKDLRLARPPTEEQQRLAALGFTTAADAVVVNTDQKDEVLVTFQVDAARQLIIFTDHVYVQLANGVGAPDLSLETSFQMRDTLSNQVVRTIAVLASSGPLLGTPPAIVHHDDVQFMVASRVAPRTLGVTSIDHNLAEMRTLAAYYLLAEAAKYELKGTGSRTYPGIVPIPLDGAIHQVTWTVGESGSSTTVSRNCEHASYIPPFPQRLRLAYLASPGLLERPKGHPGEPKEG